MGVYEPASIPIPSLTLEKQRFRGYVLPQSGKVKSPVKSIYFDYTNQKLVNAAGTFQSGVYPSITYQENAVWQIQLYNMASGTPVVMNVGDATAWEAVIDYQYDSTSSPMVYTTNANIDASRAASGILTVTLDAETAPFLAALVAKGAGPLGTAVCFNLKGYNGSGRVQYLTACQVNAFGMVYPAGTTPPAPASNYYDKGEVDGIVGGLQTIAGLPAAVKSILANAFTFDSVTGKLTAINWLDSSSVAHTMTMNPDGSLHTNP